MTLSRKLALAVLLALPGLPALADPIEITDAYARAATPTARSGAAFMHIRNMSGADDRLIAARTDSAARTEIHNHIIQDGVAMMRRVEDGLALPADGELVLERGGNHLMLMGLTEGLAQGDEITVTLIFELAGELTLVIPVDLTRVP